MDKAGSLTLPAQNDAYAYDALDNWTKKTVNGVDQYAVFDAANQLVELRSGSPTGALTHAFVYDANGNLTQKCEGTGVSRTTTTCSGSTVSSFTWNPDDQLIAFYKPGVSESYQYDQAGRRIAKTSNGITTYYRYNGDDIDAEYSATWSETARYVHGPNTDDPLMRLTGQTNDPSARAVYYHQDGINSVVATSDQSGNIVAAQLFDAWGNRVQSSGTIQTYGYTGREPDATGMIYYRARYYDPTLGRFISRDPAGMPNGVNRYAYVNNDPVNNTDPSGEICVPCAFAAGGALVNVAMQGIQDYRAGKLSSAGTYLGAAASGAAGGVALLYGGGVATTVAYGSAGALVGNFIQQNVDMATGAQKGGYSVRSAVTATVAGGVAAGVLKPFAGVIKPKYASTAQGLMTKYANGTISRVAPKTATKMVPSVMVRENTVPEGLLSDALQNGANQVRSSPANGSGNAYSGSNSGSQNMSSFAQLSAPPSPTLGSGNYSSGGYSMLRSK